MTAKAIYSQLDVESIRAQFPGLQQEINGHPLAYLDNAATTQKPQVVLDAVLRSLGLDASNIHRGIHTLSHRATEAFESARDEVASFLSAASSREVVFVRGATEGVNLVASAFLAPLLEAGDEVLVTEMEHHSNWVPWQWVCQQRGARLVVARVDDRGELDREDFIAKLGPKTRLAAFCHVSNVLGTVNPVSDLCSAARERGIPTLVDGAQALLHGPQDVPALGCDFYVASGHKLFAPTGIGILWGRSDRLQVMGPYQLGGGMIQQVGVDETTFAPSPQRLEAGTPDIAGAVGLGAALHWLASLDQEALQRHERELMSACEQRLQEIDGVTILGRPRQRLGAIPFVFEGVHPHDVGTILDQGGVAVRSGHHCAQPLMARLHQVATVRASFAVYNTLKEVDVLAQRLLKVKEVFRR
ncbi:MAG: SufS family cysteine desulfurase [Acidobacteriota bacterium]